MEVIIHHSRQAREHEEEGERGTEKKREEKRRGEGVHVSVSMYVYHVRKYQSIPRPLLLLVRGSHISVYVRYDVYDDRSPSAAAATLSSTRSPGRAVTPYSSRSRASV